MNQVITLSIAEIEIAKTIGGLRRIESLQRRLKDAYGFDGANAWDIDIEGAAAELAYCKFRGVYFGGVVNNFKKADVGQQIQIRNTHLPNGSLILRSNDPDDHYYILVVGKIPIFNIRGWIKGSDGKRPEWWKAPNGRPGAWFVPQSALQQFTEIKA